MEKAEVFLFTSPTCPHCPGAKKMIESFAEKRNDFVLHMHPMTSIQGHELAQQFGVMSVPTFIIRGPGHPENIGSRGTPSEEMMTKYLDVATGKQPVEVLKQPTLTDKLRQMFSRN